MASLNFQSTDEKLGFSQSPSFEGDPHITEHQQIPSETFEEKLKSMSTKGDFHSFIGILKYNQQIQEEKMRNKHHRDQRVAGRCSQCHNIFFAYISLKGIHTVFCPKCRRFKVERRIRLF